MGYEYILKVPEEYRASAAEEVKLRLPKILASDAGSSSSIEVYAIPEGLFICDNLSNPQMAALIFRRAIDLLLSVSPTVCIEDA